MFPILKYFWKFPVDAWKLFSEIRTYVQNYYQLFLWQKYFILIRCVTIHDTWCLWFINFEFTHSRKFNLKRTHVFIVHFIQKIKIEIDNFIFLNVQKINFVKRWCDIGNDDYNVYFCDATCVRPRCVEQILIDRLSSLLSDYIASWRIIFLLGWRPWSILSIFAALKKYFWYI